MIHEGNICREIYGKTFLNKDSPVLQCKYSSGQEDAAVKPRSIIKKCFLFGK